MIAPHILFMSLVLSTLWSIYLASRIKRYIEVRRTPTRRKGEAAHAMIDVVVVLAAVSISFAYVLRTVAVLLGLGDQVAGQVVFFSLLGVNAVAAVSAAVSLRFD